MTVWEDLVTDLQTTRQPLDGLGNVHAGFLAAYNAVHDEVRCAASSTGYRLL